MFDNISWNFSYLVFLGSVVLISVIIVSVSVGVLYLALIHRSVNFGRSMVVFVFPNLAVPNF